MNRINSACLTRQGRYDMQEVVSDMQEITRSSEKLVEINSLIMNIASQANLLSEKAIEAVHSNDADNGLAIIAHEAYRLAEFSTEQSNANKRMFTEIGESIGTINRSIDKVLNGFASQGDGSIAAIRVAGIGQADKAAEVVRELSKMHENISSLVRSVSRLSV